jgi:rSAM/selenodomain-associated transferase 2
MSDRAPLSVVIPTLDAAATLPRTLASLRSAAVGGLIREVIIADGGSSDRTADIAEAAGAWLVKSEKGRGVQLAAGAAAARGAWLLFLHADTTLDEGWGEEARAFMEGGMECAGVFRLRFDEKGIAARLVSAGAMFRTRIFALPYGDQGLLMARRLYDAIGGYRAMPLFEDVDIIDRLIRHGGRRSLIVLDASATTSAERYRRVGYARRVVRNSFCLLMYRLGVPPARIATIYG